MRLILERQEKDKLQTLGAFFVASIEGSTLYSCDTIELPWKDNQRRISCIPEGNYKVVLRKSKKFGWHLHIKDVPERTWILIHSGKRVQHTAGCPLVGNFIFVGEDDQTELRSGRKVLNDILGILDLKLGQEIDLLVTNNF